MAFLVFVSQYLTVFADRPKLQQHPVMVAQKRFSLLQQVCILVDIFIINFYVAGTLSFHISVIVCVFPSSLSKVIIFHCEMLTSPEEFAILAFGLLQRASPATDLLSSVVESVPAAGVEPVPLVVAVVELGQGSRL